MSESIWYSLAPDGALRISVYAQPQARKTAVDGIHNGALKIKVAAPALEDRANDELIRFLAGCFAVTRRDVTLLRGGKSRNKLFEVRGSQCDPAALLVSELAKQ
jgi:hypothetical protein